MMELHVTSVDYAPEELHDQVPLVFELLREIPGSDRPDSVSYRHLTLPTKA